MKLDLTLGARGNLAQRGALPNPAALLPLGLSAAAFIIDLSTPFGVADGFLYLLAVLSCFWVPHARAALYTAAALTLPMAVGLVNSPPGASLSLELANRLLGLSTIWVAAVVVWHNAGLHHERGSLLSRIRELSQAADGARYSARVEMSQWLHEGLAQELAAVAWGLDGLSRRASSPQDVRALAAELRAVIDESQRAVRNRAAALRVPVEPGELTATIGQHVAAFRRHTGIDVTTTGVANLVDIRGERAELCFTFVREALTNVAKHAQASRVVVVFLQEADVLRATVCDDGRGIAAVDRLKIGSIGLLGLEERLVAIGGALNVSNVEPHGVRVEAVMPLRPGRP